MKLVCHECTQEFEITRKTTFERKYCSNKCALRANKGINSYDMFSDCSKRNAQRLFKMKSKFN